MIIIQLRRLRLRGALLAVVAATRLRRVLPAAHTAIHHLPAPTPPAVSAPPPPPTPPPPANAWHVVTRKRGRRSPASSSPPAPPPALPPCRDRHLLSRSSAMYMYMPCRAPVSRAPA
ncbi:hypothetical protein OAO87_00455 [bacterium]|nr:hypothetical protein [bacterium]